MNELAVFYNGLVTPPSQVAGIFGDIYNIKKLGPEITDFLVAGREEGTQLI
jgi:hypothetical protein